jgi:hypothetical protein
MSIGRLLSSRGGVGPLERRADDQYLPEGCDYQRALREIVPTSTRTVTVLVG